MKVQVRNLLPNPYRDIKDYPVDEEKAERLVTSIGHTGYWPTLVGRRCGKKLADEIRRLRPGQVVQIKLPRPDCNYRDFAYLLRRRHGVEVQGFLTGRDTLILVPKKSGA